MARRASSKPSEAARAWRKPPSASRGRPRSCSFSARRATRATQRAGSLAGELDRPLELALEVAQAAQPAGQRQQGPEDLQLGGLVAAPQAELAVFVPQGVEDLFARRLFVLAADVEQRRQGLGRAGQQPVGRPAVVAVAFGEHPAERVAQAAHPVGGDAGGEGAALRLGAEAQGPAVVLEEVGLEENLLEAPGQVDAEFGAGLDQVAGLDRTFGERQHRSSSTGPRQPAAASSAPARRSEASIWASSPPA